MYKLHYSVELCCQTSGTRKVGQIPAFQNTPGNTSTLLVENACPSGLLALLGKQGREIF